MSKSVRDQIQEGAQRQVLEYALLRPECALVLAGSVLLAGANAFGVRFIPGQWWMYLIAGGVGYVALAYSTLKDPAFIRSVMHKLFARKFDAGRIRNKPLRERVQQALDYRASLHREIDRSNDGVLDEHLRDATRDFDEWIGQVYALAQGLDNYLHDTVLGNDMQRVPQELERLTRQLSLANTDELRDSVRRARDMKARQWDTLQRLQQSMGTAQTRLEETLAAMGTLYSQIRLIGNKDSNNARARRLSEEMHEQVRALADTQAALEDVYGANVSRAANLSN
jgi:DNA repair exonuclease SbcCD ATPase subunit